MYRTVDLRPHYPFDAPNVPGDYVLRGDGWWVPHPVIKRKCMSMRDTISIFVASLIPRRIVYWCAFRVIANATTGKHSTQEVPALLAIDAMARWEPLGHDAG